MTPHLKYLSYVIRHKWFVLLAGWVTGAPLLRLIIHDWSKFLPCEWGPYVRSFYGGERTPEVRAAFDLAWNHHQKANKHHWQYWVLINDSDEPKVSPQSMPEKFICEMVADWDGAGRAITGKWEVKEWYGNNGKKMLLHESTRLRVTHLLEDF